MGSSGQDLLQAPRRAPARAGAPGRCFRGHRIRSGDAARAGPGLEPFPFVLAHGNVSGPLFLRASSPDQAIPPDRDLLQPSDCNRNYPSWSLRGVLLARLSGIGFVTEAVPADDPAVREDLLLRSSSVRYPWLVHDGVRIWDVLAIAEYLNEAFPAAGIPPDDRQARALCRSRRDPFGFRGAVLGPADDPEGPPAGLPGLARSPAGIEAIEAIRSDCLARSGGPWLFGARPSVAGAMHAPAATRFRIYDV